MSITYITFSKDFEERYAEYREMLLGVLENKKSVFEVFDGFSEDNLARVRKVLKIVLEALELQQINRLTGNKISIESFKRESITKDEVENILSRTGCVKIKNYDLYKTTESKTVSSNVMIPSVGLSLGDSLTDWQKNLRKDLDNYLFLDIKNLEGLKKLKEHIDKKINTNPDPNDLTQKTDEELKQIIRSSADNAHIPSSIHHRAKQELEFRNMAINNKKEKPIEPLIPEVSAVFIEKTKKEKIGNVISKANFKDGILHFQSKMFDFNRKDNQKELLDVLFKEPKKDWSYDEIQGEWDENWDGVKKNNPASENYWRKFYTAGDGINKAIAVETTVKDFILKDTGTNGKIRINLEYL